MAIPLNADKQFLKNHTQLRGNGDGNKVHEEKENVLRSEALKVLKQCDGQQSRYGDESENNRNNLRKDRQSNENNEYSGNSWSSNRSGSGFGSQNNEDGDWNMFR